MLRLAGDKMAASSHRLIFRGVESLRALSSAYEHPAQLADETPHARMPEDDQHGVPGMGNTEHLGW